MSKPGPPIIRRDHTVTVRMGDYVFDQLRYAAALEMRTKSGMVEWICAQYINDNLEKINALRKLKHDEVTP